jgi:hypothetical protein
MEESQKPQKTTRAKRRERYLRRQLLQRQSETEQQQTPIVMDY